MSRRTRAEEARITREVASRAIRRLDLLEWVTLLGAAGLAATGGFLVAVLLAGAVGLPMRPTWVVASLLLFGVPGVIALRRLRRDEHAMRARIQELKDEYDGRR